MNYKTAYKMVTKDNLKEYLNNLMELINNLDLDNISNLKDLRNITNDITIETNDLINILKNDNELDPDDL